MKDEEARLPVFQALMMQKLTKGKLFKAEITENDSKSVKAWFDELDPSGIMLSDFAKACGITLVNGVKLYNAGKFEELRKAFVDSSKVVILDNKTRENIKKNQGLNKAMSKVNYRMLHQGNTWAPLHS
jgi:hypothetical protein